MFVAGTIFLVVMGLWSILSIVFAFVAPPQRLEQFFRIPAIFIFLPDRYVVPAGRVFTGLVGLGATAWIATKIYG